MCGSHGDGSLFGPHLNPALPTRFLLSVNYARFPLMHLDFQKFVLLKLGYQSRSPTFSGGGGGGWGGGGACGRYHRNRWNIMDLLNLPAIKMRVDNKRPERFRPEEQKCEAD